MNPARVRKILVTMPTINRPERLKLDGILAYAHEKTGERWQILLDFGALSGAPAPLSTQRADGVIAYVDSEARRREIVAARIPAAVAASSACRARKSCEAKSAQGLWSCASRLGRESSEPEMSMQASPASARRAANPSRRARLQSVAASGPSQANARKWRARK